MENERMASSWTMLLRKDHEIIIENEISKSIFKGFDKKNQRTVCIKSFSMFCDSSLNEVYLLRTVLYDDRTQTTHQNLINLLSIKSLSMSNSIYLIFDYAENRDLATHGLFHGGTERQLTAEQIQSYLYQLLSAVTFCHDRLVFHCAIELKHLLINTEGKLKLSNFEYAKHGRSPTMTIQIDQLSCFNHVPPELLLGDQALTEAIDIWSIGCVFGELCSLTQIEPLFHGNNQIELIFSIFSVLGTPTEDVWPMFSKQRFYQSEFPRWTRRNDHFFELTKFVGTQALDLMRNLLVYDRRKRLTGRMAQQHQYFSRQKTHSI